MRALLLVVKFRYIENYLSQKKAPAAAGAFLSPGYCRALFK
jgi:hypothetical protein